MRGVCAASQEEGVWVENSPGSLVQQAATVTVSHLNILKAALNRPQVYIPPEIAHLLISSASDLNKQSTVGTTLLLDLLASHLPDQVGLSSLVLDGVYLTANTGISIFSQSLKRVVLKHCAVDGRILPMLKANNHNLQHLTVYNSCNTDWLEEEEVLSNAHQLKRLSIGYVTFNYMLDIPSQLTHIQITDVKRFPLSPVQLGKCDRLVSLSFHNVSLISEALPCILKLTQLQHLEISQLDAHMDIYEEKFKHPETTLQHIVQSLPHLRSLDISGTNLAVPRNLDPDYPCDISGLESRISNPLDFLGIFHIINTSHSFHTVPARIVLGNQSEERIIVAAQTYIDRANAMVYVLKDLMDHSKNDTNRMIKEGVDVVVRAMARHLHNEKIQSLGSACLYYILRQLKGSEENKELCDTFNIATRKKVLKVILDGMRFHREDRLMVRNGVLSLWQFQIPEDIALYYKEVVETLLFNLDHHHAPEDVPIQRSSIILLNSLVCHAEGEGKKIRGREIIRSMLTQIKFKLQNRDCDEILEIAWSTMWNVTDETPENSQAFLNLGGMNLFLRCKLQFPAGHDLLRNMMGLLGNISEDANCRTKLMNSDFIEEFSFLLDSNSDGIEVSYNAAGVISHMASDGPEAWVVEEPSRDRVLVRMLRAIHRWPVVCERNINYRSLKPIIGLLDCSHTPECQLWSTWALANLSLYDSDKYCKLISEEGGETKIKEIYNCFDRDKGQGSAAQPNSNKIYTGDIAGPLGSKMFEVCEIVISSLVTWRKKQIIRAIKAQGRF